MKILIMQSAFIGDVILALPLAEAVKQSFPESEIHFLTLPAYKKFVEKHSAVYRVIADDKKDKNRCPVNFLSFCAKLRKEKYDIALVVHRSFRSALMTRLAGIKKRVGFDISPGSFFFTEKVKYEQASHEIERNLSLARRAGFDSWDGKWNMPFDEDFEEAEFGVPQSASRAEKPLAVISPFSNWGTKRWPAEYWIKLIDLLGRDFRVAAAGAPGDVEGWGGIKKAVDGEVMDFVGETDFLELASLVKNAQLLITGDSAPLHLASAYGVPTVAIFGPTVPAFGFGPFRQKNIILQKNLPCRPCNIHGPQKCPLGHHRCMRDISPGEALGAARKLLDETRK
ncbi:MAG: glycosyltransferase family 9 protein [Candidatus Omnitrophota bacterium]|nr:glycosyltransferase family 9 protein [Candidatus Omnitrophota bacterium]MBU2528878.1 glycosyltransferase family 9 protein [bacterium]MBU3930011.1 glycosyltransferase family 9 protein [bacterium]MBU4123352.1 glycosyltransferase family 9 protein [bacterium]